jgi:hypothetical protein
VTRHDAQRWARRVIWAATLLAAVLVAVVPGAGALARAAFALEPASASVGEYAAIASNNLRLVVIPVALAALGLARSPAGRVVGDALVAATLIVNGALVGAVVGGYGLALLPSLVHLPLEWEAFAVAAAAWGIARGRDASQAEDMPIAAASAALVLLAAAVEVYATPAVG